MVQQLSFARALLGDPRLLLLDEPTRSMDAAAVTRFWSALDRRPSVAVILASHHGEDLDRCDERIDLS
jgi:ABC-type multidrug transport system ATPase subunit